MTKYSVYIDDVFDQYLNDLKSLVEIPSVLTKGKDTMPFGQGIHDALVRILVIADTLGFRTFCDPKGFYGYAEIGSGDEMLGVLGHVDVVSGGNEEDWISAPFEMIERDGLVYGRGVSDDKGPLLASMYALRILLDQGHTIGKRVRFIFGTDEENLWRCMKAYTEQEEIPSLGFTPDSQFPLIYAEKGLISFELEHHQETDYYFGGGTSLNAVPDRAIVTGADLDVVERVLVEKGRKFEFIEDGICVYGKAVHAKEADQGENAIVYLAEALRHVDLDNPLVACIVDEFYNPNGEGVFGVVEDDISGKLMLNVGRIETDRKGQKLGIDIRFPVSFDVDVVRECIGAVAKAYGLRVTEIDYLRSINVDKDSFLVQSLMEAYQTVTEDRNTQPLVSGGATYARALDNVVAFGAKLPGFKNTEHQVNECISIEGMKTAMEIYIKAFYILTGGSHEES